MTDVISIPTSSWAEPRTTTEQERALRALEGGNVLLLPQLQFPIINGEDRILSPAMAGKAKNVSLDPSSGTLRGGGVNAADQRILRSVMERFATSSRALLRNLLPRYEAGLQQGRTSFRPAEIAGRPTSWRKDDTRLHIDSFPSSPMQGKRILRVFANVNPHGQTRTWRFGESYEGVARRYAPSIGGPIWGASQMLNMLGVTKGRRSVYDHLMLQLHDRMKADLAYQAEVSQSVHEFQAGSTWIVFTDQVSHAAMRGQYALEQSFYLPVDCMQDPSQAPLRILERLLGRELT